MVAQHGIFYFKDIAEILQFNNCGMPREVKKLEDCDLAWLQARKETYRLADVCLVLPVQARRLKHQARLLPDSRETMGVYSDASRRIFLVEMAVFSVWVEQSGLLRAMETPHQKSLSRPA